MRTPEWVNQFPTRKLEKFQRKTNLIIIFFRHEIFFFLKGGEGFSTSDFKAK